MRRKHRNDHNHGKNGFVTRNGRYKRAKSNKKMGKSWSPAPARRGEP